MFSATKGAYNLKGIHTITQHHRYYILDEFNRKKKKATWCAFEATCWIWWRGIVCLSFWSTLMSFCTTIKYYYRFLWSYQLCILYFNFHQPLPHYDNGDNQISHYNKGLLSCNVYGSESICKCKDIIRSRSWTHVTKIFNHK